jgi:hypothetical protein
MRKLILLLAALALAAIPSVADAAKKGKKRVAARQPPAQQQMAPGEPAARVIAGLFREIAKIGQPAPPPKRKEGQEGLTPGPAPFRAVQHARARAVRRPEHRLDLRRGAQARPLVQLAAA